MEEFLIEEKVYKSIIANVRESYPEEGCGVLLGDTEKHLITNIKYLINFADTSDTHRFFRIDPLDLYRTEQELKDGKEIVGFYHSHPDKPAKPSYEDVRYMIPGLIYIILSVTDKGCAELRAYRKSVSDKEQIEEVNILLK